MDIEKFKQLLEKRQLLFEQLCENCMASRVGSRGEIKALTVEQAEKCHSLREEIEKLDKEINNLMSTN